jgi:hypothetical protein
VAAITTDLINQDRLKEFLNGALTESMLAAAEPFIKEALAKIEREMRRDLAVSLISILDKSYDITGHGQLLTIRVLKDQQDKLRG